jgi:hypothetical protein
MTIYPITGSGRSGRVCFITAGLLMHLFPDLWIIAGELSHEPGLALAFHDREGFFIAVPCNTRQASEPDGNAPFAQVLFCFADGVLPEVED